MTKLSKDSIGKKQIYAKWENQEILVENTWFGGLKLFVNGILVSHNKKLLAVNPDTPMISYNHAFPGGAKSINIFCLAYVTTKIKILIDQELIAGELF